jgi:hypothetical protein
MGDIEPLDALHTDFTELRVAGGTQKAYLELSLFQPFEKVALHKIVGCDAITEACHPERRQERRISFSLARRDSSPVAQNDMSSSAV